MSVQPVALYVAPPMEELFDGRVAPSNGPLLGALQAIGYPHTIKEISSGIHQHFEVVDSTQVQARGLVDSMPHDGTWVILSAEEQTAGQGTHNRRWVSPPHVNMYATFLFSFADPMIERLHCISQVGAVAVARALKHMGFHPEIKWPNDVMLNRKKASGILCELKTPKANTHHSVCLVGIGLNVNMEKAVCDSLDQPVTSMLAESGRPFSTQETLQKVYQDLRSCVDELLFPGNDFSSFFEELNEMLAFKGEKVLLELEQENESSSLQGIFRGITDKGHLMLELADGSIRVLEDGRLKPIPLPENKQAAQ